MNRLRQAGAFAAGLLLGLLALAHAQQVATPSGPVAAVCAYNSNPPVITTGGFVYVQCTSTGALAVQ